MFTLRIKLSSWRMLPLRLAGLGHWDPSERRGTIIAALREWSSKSEGGRQRAHPLCRRLLEEGSPLLQDLRACLRDPQARLSDALRVEVAKLLFLPTSERPVEGQHAFMHQAVKLAPNHSAVYASLKLLLPSIMSMLDSDPASMQGYGHLLTRKHKESLVAHCYPRGGQTNMWLLYPVFRLSTVKDSTASPSFLQHTLLGC